MVEDDLAKLLLRSLKKEAPSLALLWIRIRRFTQQFTKFPAHDCSIVALHQR